MELTKEQKILQQVISEAWNNPTFMKDLVDNPEGTIQKLTGDSFSIPTGKRLEVVDQSNPDVVYLNIPVQPDMQDLELTDEDLEVVAGGAVPWKRIQHLFPTKWPLNDGPTKHNPLLTSPPKM